MNEDAKKGLQDLSKNRHGLATIAGIIVCIALALVAGRDLLFGLVMGTIFSSGLSLGGRISTQIAANAPAEHMMPAKIIGSLAAGAIVGSWLHGMASD